MNPSLDDVAVFVAVAKSMSITRAATQLKMPKSSVSRSLARLEEAMGADLLHRNTRRSRLSAAGEALLERADPLVAALEESVFGVPVNETVPSGTLRVTCTIDFAATLLAGVVARFVAEWPLASVEVCASNNVVDLISGGFDLAVRFSPRRRMRDSSLVARRIGTLRAALVASPAYLAKRGVPRQPSDLAAHEWITYQGAESIVVATPTRVAELAARGRIRCDDMFFARAAALAGAGIALLPSFLAAPEIAQGSLSPILPKWQIQSGGIYLLHPPARRVPRKVTLFGDMIRDALQRTGP